MDLILGMIFELLGDCLIECVFELLTRVLHWLGLQ
jgi:hypothetical protein